MKKLLILAIIFFSTTTLWAQSVSITESTGWLESAYVKWTPVTGATSYNVYYSGMGITNKQIDTQLIRSVIVNNKNFHRDMVRPSLNKLRHLLLPPHLQEQLPYAFC